MKYEPSRGLLLIALSSLFIAGTASASEEMKIKINRDLLNSDSGAKIVYNQIKSQVRTYCEAAAPGTVKQRKLHKECLAQMTNKAVWEIGHPRLTAQHRNS